jgi:F-type H+-transporting ATPase subunit a
LQISPDHIVYWRRGFWQLNSTIVTTWALMFALVVGSWLITRRLSTGAQVSRWQSLLEILVSGISDQIRAIGLDQPRKYLDFVGTLFVFISFAALCGILPGYEPPTGSLSTTAALAICVFLAVPIYGITERGIRAYLKRYAEPNFFMIPLNIVSDLSRTVALSIRLFGNVMSGSVIAGILLSVAPLFFPVLMKSLDLLIGAVQAYIFAVLATVYIAAATRSSEV